MHAQQQPAYYRISLSTLHRLNFFFLGVSHSFVTSISCTLGGANGSGLRSPVRLRRRYISGADLLTPRLTILSYGEVSLNFRLFAQDLEGWSCLLLCLETCVDASGVYDDWG